VRGEEIEKRRRIVEETSEDKDEKRVGDTAWMVNERLTLISAGHMSVKVCGVLQERKCVNMVGKCRKGHPAPDISD
jgi:hypothetical protein